MFQALKKTLLHKKEKKRGKKCFYFPLLTHQKQYS